MSFESGTPSRPPNAPYEEAAAIKYTNPQKNILPCYRWWWWCVGGCHQDKQMLKNPDRHMDGRIKMSV